MFQNRNEAGKKLGLEISKLKTSKPVVFGLARGGVVMAAPVAEILSCPFDVLVVRKLGVPTNPEFGFGAIAPGETEIIDWETAENLGLDPFRIEQIIKKEKKELYRRLKTYRGSLKYPSLTNRAAILVDDGIATGNTMVAAVDFVKILRPSKIIIAAAVCPTELIEDKFETNKVICLKKNDNFFSVGQYFKDFPQITDQEVKNTLKKFKKI